MFPLLKYILTFCFGNSIFPKNVKALSYPTFFYMRVELKEQFISNKTLNMLKKLKNILIFNIENVSKYKIFHLFNLNGIFRGKKCKNDSEFAFYDREQLGTGKIRS